MITKLSIALIAIGLILISTIVFQKSEELGQTTFTDTLSEKPPQEKFSQKKLKNISITGVGDIMMGTNYPNSLSLPPNDGKDLFKDVSGYLSSSDLTFGNLEGPLLTKGGTPKKCTSKRCVAFRMPEHYAEYLKDAGFDFVSVANNHGGDMGKEGRTSTAETLQKFDIKFAGYATHPTAIFIKNGLKIGFTAFAPNIGTLDLNDHKAAAEIISSLKKECDIVVVSFHGGAEGTGAMNVKRKREIFLNEDRGNVYEFVHTAIDAGADIIFGHGPHVPRALELYKNRLIAYSLGNFCTYAKFGLGGAQGFAPILKIVIDSKGEFQNGEIIPMKQTGRGIPERDKEGKAIKLLQKLTAADFPNTDLLIHDDGRLERKN